MMVASTGRSLVALVCRADDPDAYNTTSPTPAPTASTATTVEPVAPCGLCRQFLAEFGVQLEVLSVGTSGRRQSWVLSELLPLAFTGADIQGTGPGRGA